MGEINVFKFINEKRRENPQVRKADGRAV